MKDNCQHSPAQKVNGRCPTCGREVFFCPVCGNAQCDDCRHKYDDQPRPIFEALTIVAVWGEYWIREGNPDHLNSRIVGEMMAALVLEQYPGITGQTRIAIVHRDQRDRPSPVAPEPIHPAYEGKPLMLSVGMSNTDAGVTLQGYLMCAYNPELDWFYVWPSPYSAVERAGGDHD